MISNEHKKSRHGKNKPTVIKLSVTTDFPTWARVNKSARNEGVKPSEFLRRVITEAVWQVPLDSYDYELILRRQESRKTKGI